MSSQEDSSGRAGSRRSFVFADQAAARDAVTEGSASSIEFPRWSPEIEGDVPVSEQPRESEPAGRLALGAIAGAALLVFGATQGLSLLGSLSLLAGLALAAWSALGIVRRAGTMGKLALGAVVGVLLLVVGLVIGIHTYDAKYFGDAYPGWELLDNVGFGMALLGLVLLVVSLLGLPVVAVARAARRGKGFVASRYGDEPRAVESPAAPDESPQRR